MGKVSIHLYCKENIDIENCKKEQIDSAFRYSMENDCRFSKKLLTVDMGMFNLLVCKEWSDDLLGLKIYKEGKLIFEEEYFIGCMVAPELKVVYEKAHAELLRLILEEHLAVQMFS